MSCGSLVLSADFVEFLTLLPAISPTSQSKMFPIPGSLIKGCVIEENWPGYSFTYFRGAESTPTGYSGITMLSGSCTDTSSSSDDSLLEPLFPAGVRSEANRTLVEIY
jgi:hypothetical protein